MDVKVVDGNSEEPKVKEPQPDEDNSKEHEQSNVSADLGTVAGVVSLGNGGDAKNAAYNVHDTKGLEKSLTSATEEASERGLGGSDQSGNGDCLKSDSRLPVQAMDVSDLKSEEQSQKELDSTGKQTSSDCTDSSAAPVIRTKDQTDTSKDLKPEAAKGTEKDIEKSKRSASSLPAKEDNPHAQMKGKESTHREESAKTSNGKGSAGGKSSKELGKESGTGNKQEDKAASHVKENSKVGDKSRSSDRPKVNSANDADTSSREKAGGGGGGSGRSYSAQRSTSRGGGKRPEDEKFTRGDDKSKTGRAFVEAKSSSTTKGGRDDRKTGMVQKKERDRRDRDPGPPEKIVQKSKERDRPVREPQRDRTDREKTVDRRRENDRPGSRRLDDHQQQRSKGREERMKEDEEKQKRDDEARKIEIQKRKEEEKIKQEEEKKRQEEEQKKQEEEAARKKEEEEERHAREAHAEAVERKETKKALRAKNLAASTNWPDEDSFIKLDSSLKKNTAFIRKLKMLSDQQRESLAKEFQGLNLTKYVGEGAIAFCEAKLKMADISCAVYLCSLFHQRYSEFSSQLLQGLQRALPTPPSKKDEKEAKQPMIFDSKIRVELRFLAELIVNGIFTEKEGLPLLNNLLSSIMKGDKENHNNIAIIISFTKHCGEDFAGIIPRKHRLMTEKYDLEPVSSDIFSSQLKTAYRNLLKDHYSSLSKHLERQHKDIQNIERQNRRTLQNKGELSEERRKKYEEKQTAYQKLLMNTSTFADLIDEDMPDLPVEELTQTEMELMAIDMMTGEGPIGEFDWANSLWEDEDTRTFHENLINLRSMVPAILFKDADQDSSEKQGDKEAEKLDKLEDDIKALEIETDEAEAVEGEEQEMEEEEEEEAEDDDDAGEEETGPGQDGKGGEETIAEEAEAADGDDDPEEGEQVSNATLKMLMDAYINSLPNCVNRDHIDKAAVDFCLNFNTKHNRKKLAKALFNVPRVRLDLLPFYSRLVATLHVCMPDIAEDLNDRLRNDFRWHVRKKDQMMVESKIKVSRFIGELTKFKMFSKADTLQCLKSLIQDFRHHNIDMACALLESCGRFLFRTSDSHLKTKALLELMMRKKSKMHLNERHSTMIDNAFFYCNPPEVTKVERKVRPPMHEYIRKLLYKDLCKTTVEKVLKQIRKLPWDNQEIKQYTVKCMSNVWNLKYNNLHCLANLLAGLVVYHDDAGIQVVDAVMEDIRIGMEINHPKYNQRRVSIVKFLGELYNYRMVESSVVFSTLYTLIRFGVTLDGADSPLDPPEHLFRIRLVCTLLDTCGQFFDRSSSKKKLDCFLTYFQQYVWYKRSLPTWSSETRPFPMDVDNAISDSLEVLRPKLHIFASLEEANKEVDQLEKDTIRKVSSLLPEVQLTIVQPPVTTQGQGLPPIMEGNEDQTPLSQVSSGVDSMSLNDEDDDMSDDEDRRGGHIVGSHSASNSQSQNTGEEQEEMYNDYGDDHEAMESAGENEEDDLVTVITGGPKLLPCQEDEDFTSAFDKMLSDNIQQRNAEVVKVTQLDIGVPLHIKARTPVIKPSMVKPFQLSVSPDEDPGTVNFVLMTRKGNKQQFKEFEVPISSELAANLKNREEAEKAEKQRMKELTLTINERQEEEDYEEMLASMQRPGISVPNANKARFHHPKGAPNTDQIFNAKGNRKW